MSLLCYTLTTLLLCAVAWSSIAPVGPCHDHKCKYGYRCVEQVIFCVVATDCPPPVGVCRRIRKPGSCPRQLTYAGTGRCRPRPGCRDDADCPGTFKCCRQSRCGRRCIAPVLVKPGRCPSTSFPITTKRSARCHHGCTNDYECKGQKKCCNAGICGKRCMNPHYTLG